MNSKHLAVNRIDYQSPTQDLKPAFFLKIANQDEKNSIMRKIIKQSRQTMNLRLAPAALLISLFDRNNSEIAGWIGLDYQYNPKFPEVFSLFIIPKYRNNHLSLILRHAAYSILKAQGIKKAYVRMESFNNPTLVDYNTSSGFYRILSPNEIDPQWKKMCCHCELYGVVCKSQVYLEVDVINIVNALDYKLKNLTSIANSIPLIHSLIKKDHQNNNFI